jgi:hypothetical protein
VRVISGYLKLSDGLDVNSKDKLWSRTWGIPLQTRVRVKVDRGAQIRTGLGYKFRTAVLAVVYTYLCINLVCNFSPSHHQGYREPSPQNIMDPTKLAKLQAQAAANRIGKCFPSNRGICSFHSFFIFDILCVLKADMMTRCRW